MEDLMQRIKATIHLYDKKINQQNILERDLKASIRRKRGRREEYRDESHELAVVRARKQAYIQAHCDLDALIL